MPKPATRPSSRVRHGARAGAVGELADRLGHAEEAARRTGLPGRELAAAGVVGEVAVVRHACARARTPRPRPSRRSQVLELHHHDHRVVVVGLDEVDVVRAARRPARRARRGRCASRRAPSPDLRRRRCGARSRRGRRTCGRPRSRARSSLITRKASAPAQGITQSNRWIGSEIGRAAMYSSSVSGFLNSAFGILQRVAALGDARCGRSPRASAPNVRM